MGVIQPIIIAGPPTKYLHHCLRKDTRWTVCLVHGSDTMLNIVDSCKLQVEMYLLPNGHAWLPPQHTQKETLPHTQYELMFVPYVTAYVKTWNPGMQDKSSIIDWHSSFTGILFLLKTALHNIPSSKWIMQQGHVISKMEVCQISCHHTNLADTSTPSEIWKSHSGDCELCCRFWDVTLYRALMPPSSNLDHEDGRCIFIRNVATYLPG